MATAPLIASTQESQNENQPWSELIKTETFSIGLKSLFSQVKTTKTSVCNAYFRRKLDIFYQNAFSQLNDEDGKLRTYGKIKKALKNTLSKSKLRTEQDSRGSASRNIKP